MYSTVPRTSLREEGPLLYALNDAIDSEGLVAEKDLRDRWHYARARINWGSSYEEEAEELFSLIEDIAASGAIASTWIEQRWTAVLARVEAHERA